MHSSRFQTLVFLRTSLLHKSTNDSLLHKSTNDSHNSLSNNSYHVVRKDRKYPSSSYYLLLAVCRECQSKELVLRKDFFWQVTVCVGKMGFRRERLRVVALSELRAKTTIHFSIPI